MLLPIEHLTQRAFAPYGDVVAPDGDDRFVVHVSEPDEKGWRFARSKVARGPITMLSRHETTRESFVPLAGTTVIVVAERDTPERIKAFLLDRGVVIHKDVWHQTVALSERSYLAISENHDVGQDDHTLTTPLTVGLGA
jgi:ureidoglycolate hydrolase